jgi:acetylornithine deacetylase/succinyl-diaminopimelate desuccinylase-like protein
MNAEAELTQVLVRNACVNDGSNNPGEERNVDELLAVLEPSASDIEIVDSAPGRRSMVAKWPGFDPAAPALMLLCHTDVVPAEPARWDRDPFGAEIHDGFIWGRGTMDMLGHVATMTLAFRDLVASGRHLPGDVILAAVADEEALGGMGMGHLVQKHADLVNADWVLTESGGVRSGPAESPQLGVLIAEKGAWRVALNISGEPGHSSLPYGVETVLSIAAEIVQRLSQDSGLIHISDEWREVVRHGWNPQAAEVITDPARVDAVIARMPRSVARAVHALTRMTIVPTRVVTDGSWNSMSAQATVELDVRTVAGQGWDDIVEHISFVLGDDLFQRVDIELIRYANATRSPIDTELWGLLQECTRQIVPDASLVPTFASGCTDARFMRERGATAYGFGLYSTQLNAQEVPMMLHGDNERVDLESLSLMRRLWSEVFDGLAHRPPHSR